MSERRRAQRVPLLQVTDISQEAVQYEATLLDLSLSGMRFQSAHRFLKDTLVRLRVEYAPLDFHLRGLVVWTREESGAQFHGVEFVNLSDSLKVMLADHLSAIQAATRPH